MKNDGSWKNPVGLIFTFGERKVEVKRKIKDLK
jgi:hypothetical protein